MGKPDPRSAWGKSQGFYRLYYSVPQNNNANRITGKNLFKKEIVLKQLSLLFISRHLSRFFAYNADWKCEMTNLCGNCQKIKARRHVSSFQPCTSSVNSGTLILNFFCKTRTIKPFSTSAQSLGNIEEKMQTKGERVWALEKIKSQSHFY